MMHAFARFGAALALSSALFAQPGQPLTLGGRGGSFPGTLAMELRSASLGTPGAILLSGTPGPIQLRLIFPNDPRVLHVGAAGLEILTGIFLAGGKLTVPAIPVPNDPAFLDATVYLQGFTWNEGTPTFISRISQPAPIRFAPAGRFRDRRTQFVTPRAFFPIVWRADQRPMMVGGGSGALLAQIATKKTETYDALTDAFVPGPDMTVERSLHSATLLKDGRYLVVGGVDVRNDPQNTAEIYDTKNDRFVRVASMSIKRAAHSATLLPNGKVLVAGGIVKVSSKDILGSIGSIQKTTEIYDPATNTWTRGPDMRHPRAGHVAVSLPDGKVLLAGGISWFRFIVVVPQILKECDIYDPATNRIVAGPSMGTPHAVGSVVRLSGNRWLVAGGGTGLTLSGGGNITVTDVAEIYDFARNSWVPAGKMSSKRAALMAFPIGNGRYIHLGGGTGSLLTPIASDATDIYDEGTGRWTPGPKMSASRLGFGAYRNHWGQIHLLGGGSGANATVRNTTDWFYP